MKAGGGLLLLVVACVGCCSLLVLILNGSQSARGDTVELQAAQHHTQLAAASQGRGAGLTKHSRFGPRSHGSEYGRAIFERLRTGGRAGARPKTALPQLQQATGGDSAEVENTKEGVGEEEEEEEEEEGPPKTVYVYDGREVQPDAAELTTYILAVGFAIPDVRYIKSSSEADMRCARPS
jgi:hypothetical protein